MESSVSDEVDVLMSNGGMGEYQLVSDKHLYLYIYICPELKKHTHNIFTPAH